MSVEPAEGTAAKPTAAEPLVAVRQLQRDFVGVRALKGIDFSIEAGEIVGLLGPNGAGKTTCLRILAGLMPPTAGEVRIGGVDVARDSLGARRLLGYLPEGAPLYPELRVEEYLLFRARLRRIPRRRRAGAIDEVLGDCGLTEVRRRSIGQLSQGYRQRVALADALLGKPPLLLLDEPTGGLDPNQLRDVRQLIGARAGAQTVLLSTHLLGEVEALCTRALFIDGGSLVADGPVEQICDARGAVLVLELRGDAEAIRGELAQLADVARVDIEARAAEIVGVRLRGSFDGAALGERVAELAQQHGWRLRELRVERAGLEQAFARLTSGAAGEVEP